MQCTVNSECRECIDDGAWENGYDSSSKKYTCNQANKKLLCFANGGSKRCDFQANSQNPGMLCHHDSQCINSRCLNKEYKTINGFQTYFGRCRKVDIGEYCKKDSDCISNAGCYDGFCNWKPNVVDEGKQCNHRSQCKNFLKCKNDYGIITHGKQISFKNKEEFMKYDKNRFKTDSDGNRQRRWDSVKENKNPDKYTGNIQDEYKGRYFLEPQGVCTKFEIGEATDVHPLQVGCGNNWNYGKPCKSDWSCDGKCAIKSVDCRVDTHCSRFSDHNVHCCRNKCTRKEEIGIMYGIVHMRQKRERMVN